jgi:hypothetical protein
VEAASCRGGKGVGAAAVQAAGGRGAATRGPGRRGRSSRGAAQGHGGRTAAASCGPAARASLEGGRRRPEGRGRRSPSIQIEMGGENRVGGGNEIGRVGIVGGGGVDRGGVSVVSMQPGGSGWALGRGEGGLRP